MSTGLQYSRQLNKRVSRLQHIAQPPPPISQACSAGWGRGALWAGRRAGLAVPRMPARGAALLLINTQATLGEFLIGIWGMHRLHVQAAGLFLVLFTNTVPPPL